ncbi:MAG: hypothetical protein WAO58_01180 [Fimbriimonadaceae bacterium]
MYKLFGILLVCGALGRGALSSQSTLFQSGTAIPYSDGSAGYTVSLVMAQGEAEINSRALSPLDGGPAVERDCVEQTVLVIDSDGFANGTVVKILVPLVQRSATPQSMTRGGRYLLIGFRSIGGYALVPRTNLRMAASENQLSPEVAIPSELSSLPAASNRKERLFISVAQVIASSEAPQSAEVARLLPVPPDYEDNMALVHAGGRRRMGPMGQLIARLAEVAAPRQRAILLAKLLEWGYEEIESAFETALKGLETDPTLDRLIDFDRLSFPSVGKLRTDDETRLQSARSTSVPGMRRLFARSVTYLAREDQRRSFAQLLLCDDEQLHEIVVDRIAVILEELDKRVRYDGQTDEQRRQQVRELVAYWRNRYR